MKLDDIESAGVSIARLAAIIAMQNEIARASLGFDQVIGLVVERAMALTGATGAVVELVDGETMLYRAACGALTGFVGLRIPHAGSLAGLCVARRVALYAADTAVDDRVDRAACRRVGAASMICVPLCHRGDAVGVLKVMSDRCHAFDPAAVATAELLGDVIAASMHQAREYDAAVELSMTDGLTGLANRRAFERRLARELARSAGTASPLSLALFDLDGLKAANDTLGHPAGDAILCDAARLLRGTLRASDGCFRLGGDEFAAILPEAALDIARGAVGRYCRVLASAQLGQGTVGVSAGVAQAAAGETPDALVARADAALYEDKRHNRRSRAFAAGRVPIAAGGSR